MDLHPDFSDLLAEFAHCGVSYAVIGGYAIGYHAKPRATKDLDLLVSGQPANLERVASALAAFGAPANVVEAARHMSSSEVVYLGVAPVRIDILRSADGIETEDAIARADRVRLGDVEVLIVCLEDLIANKRASGRPQDLADVALLEHARDRWGR